MSEVESRQDAGTFDYVIVGAGSAGCCLANRLSADPGAKVLLLEAGGKDNWFWIHVPVGYLYTQNTPRTDWCYKTEAEAGLNGRALNYPRGRVLGGSSSINGMIYMRGQARDYDLWRQLGNAGWSWEEVLPYFKRSEDHYQGADEFHGAGGEWRVEAQRLSWPILDAFRAAAAECGIPPTDDFNRGDNEGCGYFQVNQKRGIRWSSAKAFLRPVLNRPNLTVMTGALVERLVLDGRRVTGIDFRQGDTPKRVMARGEVILAAGSVGSVQILELSGIGDPAVLKEHGIEVAHALPGVGGNLQDHLQMRMIFKIEGCVTLNQRAATWLGKAGMGLEYLLFRRGPLSMAPSQLGAFTKSDPSRETPNLQYHVQPLSLDKFGDPLHAFPAITASVCNLRPESRGSIHIRSGDFRDPPLICPQYLSAPADRQVAAAAIRLTRRICKARALEPYKPVEYRPGAEIDSDEALAVAAGDIGTTIFHPVGTCRMGPGKEGGDDLAVVDARLKVRGLQGLRVADASVMPTITSGNTNSPTIMIAEKAADMVREDARAG